MILKLVEILATVTDAIFMMWFIPRFFNTSIKKGNKPILIFFITMIYLYNKFIQFLIKYMVCKLTTGI